MTVDDQLFVSAYLGCFVLSEGTEGGAMSLLRKLHLQPIQYQLCLFVFKAVPQAKRSGSAARQQASAEDRSSVQSSKL